jgi:hypothetical protein
MRDTVLAALVAAGIAHSALAAPSRFIGPHPVAERAGGGFCYVEAPHLHSYAPAPSAFYVATPAGYGFVGDPTPFGYAGERHIYYGHHPLTIGDGQSTFCFIDGPHYHAVPARGAHYTFLHDVAFYVGPLSTEYVDARAKRWKPTNDAFAPFERFRPEVGVIVPPPEWGGRIYTPANVKIQLPKRIKTPRHTRVRVEVRD